MRKYSTSSAQRREINQRSRWLWWFCFTQANDAFFVGFDLELASIITPGICSIQATGNQMWVLSSNDFKRSIVHFAWKLSIATLWYIDENALTASSQILEVCSRAWEYSSSRQRLRKWREILQPVNRLVVASKPGGEVPRSASAMVMDRNCETPSYSNASRSSDIQVSLPRTTVPDSPQESTRSRYRATCSVVVVVYDWVSCDAE